MHQSKRFYNLFIHRRVLQVKHFKSLFFLFFAGLSFIRHFRIYCTPLFAASLYTTPQAQPQLTQLKQNIAFHSALHCIWTAHCIFYSLHTNPRETHRYFIPVILTPENHTDIHSLHTNPRESLRYFIHLILTPENNSDISFTSY
jgi:hypothetical protein